MSVGGGSAALSGVGEDTERFAGRLEICRWVLVAAAVATALLVAVAFLAAHDHGDPSLVLGSPLLSTQHSLGDMLFVFRRNLLVLGIHVCACWIGALVADPGRRRSVRGGRLGRLAALERPVPVWMGRAALGYALAVTLLSVGLQAIALGRLLADLSAATHLSPVHLLLLVLPHAVPELLAVFLPLGLFLLDAHRDQLARLGPRSLQAAAIAVLVLLCAAAIETYVTPARVLAATQAAAVAHAPR